MQELAAFVIVALAAAYAIWKLMPRALRVRLTQKIVGIARRRGQLSERDAAALAKRLTASGCGSCDTCGTCAPAPKAAPDNAAIRFVPGHSGSESPRL